MPKRADNDMLARILEGKNRLSRRCNPEGDVSEELIGMVSHYFAKPQVGVVALTGEIKLGDVLHFSGHGADFQQAVTSMQVDHVPVETASPGTAVALKV